MTGDEGKPLEDRLADLLAEYDDLLAAGKEASPEGLKEAVDPELLPEWNRLAAFLNLVEQAWPRGGEEAGCLTEPAPTAAHPSAASSSAETVRQFGRFQILRTLGQGGFGVVFLAWDPALRRQVALKVPQPEALVAPEARKRFLREAHAAAGLDHPNIVPVYESDHVGTVGYIAAAYCPGPTLAEWLGRQARPVPVRDAAGLVAMLARAVQHAHERGVLHRDLKPSNVLLQRASANDQPQEPADSLAGFHPRITDFSLASIADGEGPNTWSGVPFGSPPYMSPEQAEGRLKTIGPPTDVYGLGCVLHEILTGHPPFRGESQLDTLRQVIEDDPVSPRSVRRDIPSALEGIALKCLEKDPARRYPTARDLAEDLDRFLAGEPTRARPPARWEIIRRKVRRHPAVLAIVVLSTIFAAAFLGGGYWFKTRLDQSRTFAQQRENEAHDRDLAARRARYVADVRLAKQLIDDHNTIRALRRLGRHRPQPGEEDMREFAWHYLMRRADTSRLTLRGFADAVYHVEFSPRGDLLAAASKDGTVQIWDTTTWQLVRRITASPTEVNIAAFSPDGKTLATVDDDGKLKLWGVATGHLRREVPAHSGDAVIARFAPDGKTLITGGRNDRQIKVWDPASARMLDGFQTNNRVLENAVFSPDGSILACVGSDTNTFWRLSDRTTIAWQPANDVQGVAFSHDGTKLATAHQAGQMVRFWDVSNCRLLREFRGHSDGVFAVAFSRDDQMVISAGGDMTIRFWNTATGEARGLHQGHIGKIWNLAISPDGRTLASASSDGAVKLWDAEPPRDHDTILLDQPLAALRFSADGKTLATLEKNGTFSLIEAERGTLLKRLELDASADPHRSGFFAGAGDISRDLRTLLVATGDGAASVWDAQQGRRRALLGTPKGPLDSLGITPDGLYAYIAGLRPGVEFWELKGPKLLTRLEGDYGRTECLSVSNQLLIHDLGRNFPLLWEPLRGRIQQPATRLFRPRCLTFSTDGHALALHNDLDGEPGNYYVHLWDIERWLPIGSPIRSPVDLVSLAFDPTSRTLAGGAEDGKVRLWDVVGGEDLLTLEGHSGLWIGRIAFSPDGKTLATQTGRADGKSEIFLWHTAEDQKGPAGPGQDKSINPAF